VVTLEARGGGGTELAPIWRYVVDQGLDPCVALRCTDFQLCRADLGEDPGYPVLILSTDRAEPFDRPVPFGEVVRMELP
jgi:hypothetical protein